MLTNGALRRPLIVAMMMMLAQQLSGINAILYFSSSVFARAGVANGALASAVVGLANVLGTALAAALMDRAGRVQLLSAVALTAALAGVLFALLFGTAIILIRSSLPEGAEPGSQWLEAGNDKIRLASELMPFAGICFLWFIGVVRADLGRLEDKFFATVTLGSGLLFLAMMFTTAAVGAALAVTSHDLGDSMTGSGFDVFGQMLLLKLSKTYAVRMAAVFMMSLATIWLRTGLMPRWLVALSYLAALTLIIGGDVSMWLTLAFPVWVLIVSVMFLIQAGAFEGHHQR